jgi:hypothetical protein
MSRTPVRVALTLAAASVACGLAPSRAAAEPWTFVSVPDFLNADVMDITGSAYHHGTFNSTNASWETAIGSFLDRVAAENPDFVMVAGDLSMQRWTQDAYTQGVFGPKVGTAAYPNLTLATEIDRVKLASDIMYGQWNQRFTSRGLTTVLPTIGDHELGDDQMWENYNPDRVPDESTFLPISRGVIPTLRNKFTEHFVNPLQTAGKIHSAPASGEHAGTAYAVKHNNTLIVTIDAFEQKADGDVDAQMTAGSAQHAWLQSVLDSAKTDPTIDHVIVQGHTPVIGSNLPNRNSSRIYLEDGQSSPFWTTLAQRDADLYFAGEVHDISVRQIGNSPLLQVVHGAAWGFSGIPTVNYLVGEVDGDRMTLEIKETTLATSGGSLFQASGVTSVKETIALGTTWTSRGTVTIDKSLGYTRYLNTSGVFSGVNQPTAPAAPVTPLAPNDASIQGSMQLWLKDAGQTFIPGGGAFDAVWQDSSGRGHHLTSFGGGSGGGTSGTVNDFGPANDDPTLIQITVPLVGGGSHARDAVAFSGTADELMRTTLQGGGLDTVTMFIVYRAAGSSDDSLVRPAGLSSVRDGSTANNLNIAHDGSIRKDNGNIAGATAPDGELYIRIVRMSPAGGLQQWHHLNDGQGLILTTANGAAYTTADGDFFLGDLRTDSDFLTGDDFAITEVLLYNAALTDAQIAGIDAHLFNAYFVPEPAAATVALIAAVPLLLRRRRLRRDVGMLAGSFGSGA